MRKNNVKKNILLSYLAFFGSTCFAIEEEDFMPQNTPSQEKKTTELVEIFKETGSAFEKHLYQSCYEMEKTLRSVTSGELFEQLKKMDSKKLYEICNGLKSEVQDIYRIFNDTDTDTDTSRRNAMLAAALAGSVVPLVGVGILMSSTASPVLIGMAGIGAVSSVLSSLRSAYKSEANTIPEGVGIGIAKSAISLIFKEAGHFSLVDQLHHTTLPTVHEAQAAHEAHHSAQNPLMNHANDRRLHESGHTGNPDATKSDAVVSDLSHANDRRLHESGHTGNPDATKFPTVHEAQAAHEAHHSAQNPLMNHANDRHLHESGHTGNPDATKSDAVVSDLNHAIDKAMDVYKDRSLDGMIHDLVLEENALRKVLEETHSPFIRNFASKMMHDLDGIKKAISNAHPEDRTHYGEHFALIPGNSGDYVTFNINSWEESRSHQMLNHLDALKKEVLNHLDALKKEVPNHVTNNPVHNHQNTGNAANFFATEAEKIANFDHVTPKDLSDLDSGVDRIKELYHQMLNHLDALKKEVLNHLDALKKEVNHHVTNNPVHNHQNTGNAANFFATEAEKIANFDHVTPKDLSDLDSGVDRIKELYREDNLPAMLIDYDRAINHLKKVLEETHNPHIRDLASKMMDHLDSIKEAILNAKKDSTLHSTHLEMMRDNGSGHPCIAPRIDCNPSEANRLYYLLSELEKRIERLADDAKKGVDIHTKTDSLKFDAREFSKHTGNESYIFHDLAKQIANQDIDGSRALSIIYLSKASKALLDIFEEKTTSHDLTNTANHAYMLIEHTRYIPFDPILSHIKSYMESFFYKLKSSEPLDFYKWINHEHANEKKCLELLSKVCDADKQTLFQPNSNALKAAEEELLKKALKEAPNSDFEAFYQGLLKKL